MTCIHSFYKPHQVLKIHRFETLCSKLFNIKEKIKNILIFDVEDQNNYYVFVSRGAQDVYLNLNLQQ